MVRIRWLGGWVGGGRTLLKAKPAPQVLVILGLEWVGGWMKGGEMRQGIQKDSSIPPTHAQGIHRQTKSTHPPTHPPTHSLTHLVSHMAALACSFRTIRSPGVKKTRQMWGT